MSDAIHPAGLGIIVDDQTRLLGSACQACANHSFPSQSWCARCGSPTSPVALPASGTLWSWTVQRTQPKPPYEGPEPFEPFAVGYVALGPITVEARLEGRPVDAWTIGTPLRLEFGQADEAGDLWRYRFVEVSE